METRESTGKGEEAIQKGLTYPSHEGRRARGLLQTEDSSHTLKKSGFTYELASALTENSSHTIKVSGFTYELALALIFNSRSSVSMTTWVDKQEFKTKPCFYQPNQSHTTSAEMITENVAQLSQLIPAHRSQLSSS